MLLYSALLLYMWKYEINQSLALLSPSASWARHIGSEKLKRFINN